jgi:3-deoxy-7-phosphoheptulonate synthase
MTDSVERIPLKSHRRPDDLSTTVVEVGDVRFGDGSYPVIAGPMAVEGEEQILTVAAGVAAAGASMLRASTGRRGDGFLGLGDEGLWLLERAGHAAGIPTLTEVVDSKDLDTAIGHVDMLEIGPETMQHFSLLRDVGRAGKPVLLHRGPSATIDEWLMAAE